MFITSWYQSGIELSPRVITCTSTHVFKFPENDVRFPLTASLAHFAGAYICNIYETVKDKE